MIGPVHNTPVYPVSADTSSEEPVPARKKRSVETTSSVEPENASANDRARRRTGGNLDSLGRGNLL